MTELTVIRQPSRSGFTPGELLWDGQHECWTCEDVIREIPGQPVATWKVRNETAIPAGRYRVVIDFSNHFARDMPHVLEVPGFDGVRIHVGNTAADTEGCLLIGDTQTATGIAQSSVEFSAFLPKLKAALAAGEVWITYNNPPALTT
jgi:hypothetical protein